MDLLEAWRTFRRVAELGSFSRAARDLKTTQPTISRTIAALETELGVTLFRRTTRVLRLTEEGQRLLAGVTDVLPRVDALTAEVRGAAGGLAGPLRVAASNAFGRLVLARFVDRFAARHPRVRLQLRLADGLVDLVEEGVDVAIRQGILADRTGIRAVRVGTSRFRLYASRAYLAAHGQPQSIDDLRRHRLLFFTLRSARPVWSLVDLDGRPHSFAFAPWLEADAIDPLREAMVEGLGIALLPSWMIDAAALAAGVSVVLPWSTREEVPIHALTVADRVPSARTRAFVELLRTDLARHEALAPARRATRRAPTGDSA